MSLFISRMSINAMVELLVFKWLLLLLLISSNICIVGGTICSTAIIVGIKLGQVRLLVVLDQVLLRFLLGCRYTTASSSLQVHISQCVLIVFKRGGQMMMMRLLARCLNLITVRVDDHKVVLLLMLLAQVLRLVLVLVILMVMRGCMSVARMSAIKRNMRICRQVVMVVVAVVEVMMVDGF